MTKRLKPQNISLQRLDNTFPLQLDFLEVIDKLITTAKKFRITTEYGFDITAFNKFDLAEFLAKNYDATFVYNCLSTDFGQGLLIASLLLDFDMALSAGEPVENMFDLEDSEIN